MNSVRVLFSMNTHQRVN